MDSNANTTPRAKNINTSDKIVLLDEAKQIVIMEQQTCAGIKGTIANRILEVYDMLLNKIRS